MGYDQNPAVQDQPLQDLIAQRGWTLYKVFCDRVSGATERRVYRGDVDSPKRGRARKVALSSASLFLLEEWIPLTLEDQRPGQDFEVHRPTTKLRLGLRYDEIAFPVLLHALPCLRLFRRENRGDLCIVFCVNCLQRLLSGLLVSALV